MDSTIHDAWETVDDGFAVEDGGEERIDPLVRVVHVVLGLYLLPVAALVLVIGGAAVAAGSIYQQIAGKMAAPRYRPTPHMALPWLSTIRVGR